MRRYRKKQCLDLISTLEEAHRMLTKRLEKKNHAGLETLLQDSQEAAIAIGNIIEASEGEGTEAVSRLEDYCEQLYLISTELVPGKSINARQLEKRLNKPILFVRRYINSLPESLEAFFLPYKASMWDSLESIWMAADQDPACDAYVIPIPYYDRNTDGSLGKYHYEGDALVESVPIVAYDEIDLEERHPELIFIHNPYDGWNHVTTIHPAFYSEKLQGYTDCLVYVPYYATAGYMADGHAFLSAYAYCDHIVLQNESMLGFIDKEVPREKLLPLGSPKFDKMIRLAKNPPEPPAEWANKLKGKRVFFFNTSLAGFLGNTPEFLKKMAYVFDTFKGRKDACLIWRPHPLLESTIDSMRPEARPVYDRIKQLFTEQDYGILDEQPDIEKTIALCDAYLGDAGTSVTSLFGVAGKPMFILNNNLHCAPGEDDWEAWVGGPVRGDRNDRYCIIMGNRLFADRERNGQYRYLCDLSEEYSGGGYYGTVLEAAGKIIAFPANGENILLIDPEDLSRHTISLKHEEERGSCFFGPANFLFSEHPEVYYLLPNRYPSMVRFNAETEEIAYIRDEAFEEDYAFYRNERDERILAPRFFWLNEGPCIALKETRGLPCISDPTEKRTVAPDGSLHHYFTIKNPDIPGISLKGPQLICIDQTGTRLRAIQLDTHEAQERKIGLNGIYIAALRDVFNLDVFWFIPYRGTELCKWTISEDRWEKVDAYVDGLVSIKRPQRYECDEYYFWNGVFYQDKLILSPNWGNKFVELDVHTHEAREWIPPFPFTTEDKNDYWRNGGIGFFWRDAFDYSCRFYYASEHVCYVLNLEKGTCRREDIDFDKEDVFRLAPGFHRESQWMPYCCYEDIFNTLENIIEGHIYGPAFDKETQITAYQTVNASPEGNCGERVWERLKRSK